MKPSPASPRPPLHSVRLRIALAAAFFSPAVHAADSPHLEKLRLLPPVLIQGETGSTLDDRMRHYKIEGVSVAVFRDGRILWTEARGLADRDVKDPATTRTLFQAGSISKPVAAAGVHRRVEAGFLRLDSNVNDYLKSWKVPENPLTAKQKVTLERILSHSAGLTVHGFPGYAAGDPVPTVQQILDGQPPANTDAVRVDLEPGTKHRYSGGAYTVAQLVMTDTLAKPFPELMLELVLGPAGMAHSTYEQPLPPEKRRLAAAGYRRDGAPVPGKRHTYPEMAAAGLWTTSEDLARFAIAIGQSLRGEAGGLLSKPMAARMTTRFADDAGLGLFLETHEGETYFGHGGSDEGFQAYLIASRDHGYGAAVMVNSDNGIALASEIVRGIAREYGWKWLADPIAVAKLSSADLAPLAGRYALNGDEALTWTVRGGRLLAVDSAGPEEEELYPISRDIFVRKDRPVRYQVERSGGAVTGIVVLRERDRVPARRLPPGSKLPSDDLAAGRIEEGVAGYRKLFAENPWDPGIAEPRLNALGYQLAGRREFAKAIAILKLNTELYPASSNTYDTLAEIYLDSGDRARSLETYRKALEALPGDAKTDPGLKERIRRNAESKIRELS